MKTPAKPTEKEGSALKYHGLGVDHSGRMFMRGWDSVIAEAQVLIDCLSEIEQKGARAASEMARKALAKFRGSE